MLVILGHNSELHLSLCLRRHNFDVSSLQRNKELLQYLPPIKLSVCTAVICSTLTDDIYLELSGECYACAQYKSEQHVLDQINISRDFSSISSKLKGCVVFRSSNCLVEQN